MTNTDGADQQGLPVATVPPEPFGTAVTGPIMDAIRPVGDTLTKRLDIIIARCTELRSLVVQHANAVEQLLMSRDDAVRALIKRHTAIAQDVNDECDAIEKSFDHLSSAFREDVSTTITDLTGNGAPTMQPAQQDDLSNDQDEDQGEHEPRATESSEASEDLMNEPAPTPAPRAIEKPAVAKPKPQIIDRKLQG